MNWMSSITYGDNHPILSEPGDNVRWRGLPSGEFAVKWKSVVLILGLGLMGAGVPLSAHHSFAAEFDGNKQISLMGVVTKVDWVNPHAWVYVDVKGDDGGVINWALESGAPNALYRAGWRKDDLKVGDSVTFSAFLAKDGSHTAAARQVTLPDGRKVFAGSASSGAEQKPDQKEDQK
jgi:Family of unknown function (DUF6152)